MVCTFLQSLELHLPTERTRFVFWVGFNIVAFLHGSFLRLFTTARLQEWKIEIWAVFVIVPCGGFLILVADLVSSLNMLVKVVFADMSL